MNIPTSLMYNSAEIRVNDNPICTGVLVPTNEEASMAVVRSITLSQYFGSQVTLRVKSHPIKTYTAILNKQNKNKQLILTGVQEVSSDDRRIDFREKCAILANIRQGTISPCMLKNISEGGCMLYSTNPLRLNETIRLDIIDYNNPVAVMAKPIRQMDQNLYGIKFDIMNDEQKNRLSNIISELSNKRLNIQ